jgi:hypothetical protein
VGVCVAKLGATAGKETKRQRDKEVERQSDREIKRQRNRAENKNPEQSRVAQLVNNVIN